MFSNMQCAPIALFVYKRLWHTQQTVQSLLKNKLAAESELFIFADGAKDSQSEQGVNEVRTYLKSLTGFKKIHLIEREKNLGLAQSIIQGVTQLVNEFGKVIVVEDDLLLSPYFLQFMNDGLQEYAKDDNVASICGYVFPVKQALADNFFIPGTDCWGWATWKRAWDHFNSNGSQLLQQLQNNNQLADFDYQGLQPNVQMLKDQIVGKNNSWAIRWHASAYVKHMVSLYPGNSLVHNIGMDASGTHCVKTALMDVEVCQHPITVKRIAIQKSVQALSAYMDYFKSVREPLLRKIIRKTKQVLGIHYA